MKLKEGELITNGTVVRVITAVRETGYTWKYIEKNDELFISENSNDPFFTWGWRKLER